NALVTTGRPYRAAVSWEGVVDLRIMDEKMGGEPFRRARWGSPEDNPGPWERASQISQAAAVRTPMLLLYGEQGCPEQGQAWRSALECAGVPVELWIYPGGHLPDPEVVEEIYLRAAGWFRRWR
ncbi:MAG: prolyl oligopeptidase family serine peptidase, partial [Actinomycetota bacterium]|nr:prolyl oligopeptidase family serine peptidase [Actinomycetota bacterium]